MTNNKPFVVKDWCDDFVHCWKYYPPPARASLSDIKFIESKIKEEILKKGRENVKVLVLGSTPEYRNLCGELEVHCYCFDFSEYNYQYLSQEVKHKPKETFILGNWLDVVPEGKFDIVLGDVVLNLIFKEEYPKMLSMVSKILEKEGYFIPRTFVRGKDEKWAGEKAVEEYRKDGSKTPVYTWLGRNLYMSAFDYEKEMLTMNKNWLVIVDLQNKGLLSKKEVDELSKLNDKGRDTYFHIPVKEEFDAKLSKFFKIKSIFYGTEPYLKDKFPLHVLMRK